MNGVHQRARRSQTAQQLADLVKILQELDERIVELAGIVQILDSRTVDLGKGTAAAYNALADTVGQLHDVVGQIPVPRTLRSRLRWLLTGRI